MILRLALKNLKAKPLRALASVAAIAVAVAMFFCIFSFENAVYEYVYAVETADFGESDLMITAKSGGDRLALVEPLYGVDGVENVVPTLSVYALVDVSDGADEYIRLRGFEADGAESLRGINVVEGDLALLSENSDNVVISRAMAERFGLGVGDMFSVSGMTASGSTVRFVVAAIAENDGYFLADSPYTVIGTADDGIARLISPGGIAVYNEIYIGLADGADAEAVRETIAAMPEYRGLTVSECADAEYMTTRAGNLSAPVTIAGVAVALLSVVGIVLIFTSGIADRRAYAAKLSLVGATRGQIFAVFCLESAVLAAVGAVAGSLLAAGVFLLLLQIVLSSAVSFSVNALLLFGAAVTGGVLAFAASLFPLVKVFSSTARENLHGAEVKGRAEIWVAVALAAVTVVTLCVENLADGAKGVLSACNMVLVIATAAAFAPLLTRGIGRLMSRASVPSVAVAGYAAAREKRAPRSSRILAVGMTVSMLLFTAWSLTTSVFSDFTAEFENMILVTNVSSTVDEADFTAVEGVDAAHLMVWRQATVSAEGMDARSTNVLGSASALDLADFAYLSSREDADAALAAGQVVLDSSLRELYGVDVGDSLTLELDGVSADFTVGALVRHNLFNGAYVIVSEDALAAAYGVSPDTVVLTVTGDASEVAERVRAEFADRNYYAVPALEAYEWDTRSLENVFDLVAALAFLLTLLVFAVALANVVVGRAYSERTRSTLLCAGLSANGLLRAETAEHAVSVLPVFAVALPAAALAALCLINALSLFGLYFEFMFEAWVAAVAGLALAAAYIAVPAVFGFRRRYGMRRS